MMKRLLFVAALFGAVFINSLQAQLTITPNSNAAQLAQILAGQGVTVINPTFVGSGQAAGTFGNGTAANLGINAGVVMSTGRVAQIPQAASVFASTPFNTAGDADLTSIIGYNRDAAVLQFDLIPQGTTLTFRYQFGSEEYPDYTCSPFNDAFAFLISGNNPGGGLYNKLNLAIVPGSGGLPVSINTVNKGSASPNYTNAGCQSVSFSNFFINNQFGTSLVYDGYTTAFFTQIAVTPCDTYHLKLAIADVFDTIYDSGVFIEENSFVSQASTVTASYDPGFTQAFEGCTGGMFTITIPNLASVSTPIPYTVSGSGTNGTDYIQLTGTAFASGGSSSAIVYVDPVFDTDTEGPETVTLTIYDPCTGLPIDSATIIINDRPLDTAYATPSALCSPGPVQLTASGGGAYLWTPPQGLSNDTSATPTANVSGKITYSVEITLGSCTFQRVVNVALDTLSVEARVFPDIAVCPGTDVFLTANLTGGTAPYTYNWSPGHLLTDSTIRVTHGNPTATTEFTVVVTDTNGCSGTASVTVLIDSTPTISLGPDKLICPEDTPHIIRVPGGPFDGFQWSTGDTTGSIAVTAAGSYWVTVTRGTCQILSDTIEVNFLVPINPALGDTGFCPNSSVVLSAPVPPYSNVVWSTGDSASSITVTAPGAYYYTANDTNGCASVSDTATVSFYAVPDVDITTLKDTICPGDSTTLNAGAESGGTILWIPTGDTTQIISVTTPGIYIVAVSNATCTAYDTIEIFGYTDPNATVASDTSVCAGQPATFTLVNGPFLSYNWSNGDTGITGITVSTPGAYNVTIFDGNCNWASNNVTLSEFPTPQPALSDTGACLGETVVLNAEQGLINIIWSTGDTTQSITVSAAGTFYYTATDTNGCSAISDTVDVTFQTPPTVDINTSADTICPNASAVLTTTVSGANINYLWSPTGDTTASITVSAAGVYSVRVRDDFCPAYDTLEIFEYTHAPITIGNDTTVCPGQPVVLSPSGGPYITYLWSTGETTPTITVTLPGTYTATVNDGICDWTSLPFTLSNFTVINTTLPDTGACANDSIALSVLPGYTNILWSTGETTTTISISTPGDYSYTATDANGCAVESDTSTVTFTTAPVVNGTASADTICPNATTVLSANATGGSITYLWTPTGDTTASITVGVPGTYIVQVSELFCSVYDTIEIFEFTHAPITLGNDTTVCPGSTIVLIPSGSPYLTYSWSDGSTGPVLTVTQAGDYAVTVNDGNCTWVSDTITIGNFVVTNPTLNDTGACIGQPVILSAAGGLANISWSTGVSTTTITVTIAGDYSYTATDANGCNVQSDTATVTFTGAGTLNATASDDTICPGATSTLSSNATGSNLTYLWLPGGEATPDITVSAPGRYIITINNGFCPASDTLDIFQFTHAPVSIGNDTTICQGNPVTLTPTGGPYVTYSWTGGTSGPTLTVTQPGTYSVTVNDGNCDWVSNTITIGGSQTNTPALNDTGACQGNQIVLSTVGGLSNITWSNGPNTTTITVTTGGNYSYTATDAGGCVIRSDTSTVTFTTPPAINVTATQDTICVGGTSTLTANATGGSLTYNWQPGNGNTASIIVSQPGTYHVTVNDGFCPGNDSTTIYQHPNKVVTLNNDTTVCPGQGVTIAASGGPYTSYNWSNGSGTATVTTSTAGIYWATVNDGQCSYVSDTFTLSNTQVGTPVAHTSTSVCEGQPVTLTSDAGYTNYGWSNGTAGPSITVTAAGSYSYTATDPSGCSVTSTAAIVITTTAPVITITASKDSICPGESTTLNAGSEEEVTYTWQPGNIVSPTIQVNQPGTYYVTASSGGCSVTDSTVIVSNALPALNLQPLTIGCCQTVVLDPAPGQQRNTYQWSNGATTPTVSVANTNAGPVSLSVTVTNTQGCSVTGNTTVIIKCIDAEAIATPDSVTVGDSSTLTVTTGYDTTFTYLWSPGGSLSDVTAQSPTTAPTEATTYTVFVTDPTTGCTDSSSVTVFVVAGDKVVVPNAFTPNGDGHNDRFYPVLLGPYQVVTEFRIYNRWGALVHNSTEPWDGSFNSAAQPTGTYVYYVIVRVPDPLNQGATKDVKFNGAVTLLH